MNINVRVIEAILLLSACMLVSVAHAETPARKTLEPAKPAATQGAADSETGCPHVKMKKGECPHNMAHKHMQHMSEHMQKMHPQPDTDAGTKSSVDEKSDKPASR
jgi:hypothetical protein